MIEMIDPITGAVVRVQRDRYHQLEESELQKAIIDGREVWIQKGLDVRSLPKGRWVFSDLIATVICQHLVDGTPLTKICKMAGMPPYSVVCAWRREHPSFRDMLRDARLDRAEALRDEALEIADVVNEDQDAINKAKLRVETRKWAAEKDNPKEYGNQKAQDGAPGSVTLILNTGIIRPGDAGYREVTPHGTSQKHLAAPNGDDHHGSSPIPGDTAGTDGDGGGQLGLLHLGDDDSGSPGQF